MFRPSKTAVVNAASPRASANAGTTPSASDPSSSSANKNNFARRTVAPAASAVAVRDENDNPFGQAQHALDEVVPDSDEEVLLGSDERVIMPTTRTTTTAKSASTDDRSSATAASNNVSVAIDEKSSESLESELNTLKLTHGQICNNLLTLMDSFDGTEGNCLQQTLLRQNKAYLDSRIKQVEAELARRAAEANALDQRPIVASVSLSDMAAVNSPVVAPAVVRTPQQATSRFFLSASTAPVGSPSTSTSAIRPPPVPAYQPHPPMQQPQHIVSRPQPAQSTTTMPARDLPAPPVASTSRAQPGPRYMQHNEAVRDALEGIPPEAFDSEFELEESQNDVDEDDIPLVPQRPAVRPNPFAAGTAPRRPPSPAAVDKGKQRATDIGAAPRKQQPTYPWTRDIYKALRQRFGMQGFRDHQEEAINGTLSGRDVFVLLPTGGGKSLCFQLPACITTGKTRGVTIVVSPLLSLIEDQCAALFRRDIPTVFLNSTMKAADRNFVMRMLSEPEPQCCLAYVTPEQINKSGAFKNVLAKLHRNDQLARFVIDEAHCVSSWGHDFRPDYKELGCLKRDFPDIPIIALTATATGRVQEDIVATLHMRSPLKLQRSFNRPNLKYEVRPKSKGVLEEIATFIRAGHMQSCGIIYCSSKKQCEDTADKLRRLYRISAKHYHAGMDKNDRSRIQRGWQDGEFYVICATIAFGMGIDKPDVRYVIHFTLSQSLEAYYQETGRAGRDGATSQCILFYSYSDTKLIYRLIDEGDGTREQKETNKANVKRMVQYCMNTTDCRRKQVLSYFGENDFDENDCHKTCDNCLEGVAVQKRDVTDLAKSAISLVMGMGDAKVTMLHAIDVFRGSRTKKIVELGHANLEDAGKGSSLDRGDVERLFQLLALESAFGERFERNGLGFTNAYITVGPRAKVILSGKQPIIMSFADGNGKRSSRPPAARSGAAAAAAAANGRNVPSRDNLTIEEIDLIDDDDSDGEDAIDVEAWRPAARRLQTPALQNVPDEVLFDDIHEKCYNELVEIRDRHAMDEDVEPEDAFPSEILQEIAARLPSGEADYLSIEGMTKDRWYWFTEARALRVVDRNRHILDEIKGTSTSTATAGKKSAPPPKTAVTGGSKKRSSDEAFRGIVNNFALPNNTTTTAPVSQARTTVPVAPRTAAANKAGSAFRPAAGRGGTTSAAKGKGNILGGGSAGKKKSGTSTSGIRAMPLPGSRKL